MSWGDYRIIEKTPYYFILESEKEDFGFFYSDLREAHQFLAEAYAQKKDTEKTLYHLESAAEAVIRYMEDFYKTKYIHSSLLFKGFEDSGEGVWYSSTDNDAAELLKHTEKNVFDFLRDNEHLQMITKRLQTYSGEWSI